MTYKETIQYLYDSVPMFQNLGAGAYKEGLSTTHCLDDYFQHPHRRFKTIHVAGTNGKGSVSHTLAAILQSEGYRVGLYTSPHLVDFRERIRVNGEMVNEQYVVDFVEQYRPVFEPLRPSFFELATAMAFKYFADQKVDIAVIEVGLGGRLDCTNIITPELAVITNISLDHTQFLGDSVEKIAAEKAGIIKPHVPVVIGECVGTPTVRAVFETKAKEQGAPIFLAEQEVHPQREFELKGCYQECNARTIQSAVSHLPFCVSDEAIANGMAHVCQLTGLMGRWQQTETSPRVICDTGHNSGGWEYLGRQLAEIPDLRMVVGMVSDKDVRHVLGLMPRHARYFFTSASVTRAMPADEFAIFAREAGLEGEVYPDVKTAVDAARRTADAGTTIFVGGSTFIVADYLATRQS